MSLLNFEKNTLLFYSMILLFMLGGCKKDNDLEDIYLTQKVSNISKEQYVIAKNISQIDCTTIKFEVEIQEDILPDKIKDNIDDYQVRFEDPFGKMIVVSDYNNQWAAAKCDEESEYKIMLYKKETREYTYPYIFTFRTIR